MNMWVPYVESTRQYIPDAEIKIAFDKFHVAQNIGTAVDRELGALRALAHGPVIKSVLLVTVFSGRTAATEC